MPPELIDVCFNFTHDGFRADERAVLERAVAAGVSTMMITGSSPEESARGIALAERYPERLYATVGVHPHLAKEWARDTHARLRELAARPQVKAIGEAGLDYNRDHSARAAQRAALEQQIELACETGLPLFLHERDAHEDLIRILEPHIDKLDRVVVHCFTGGLEALERYLKLGLYIGITGWICDERRGRHLQALVGRIPAGRLMIETDAPYLLPRDLRPRPKARRNEPAFLAHIAAVVAHWRGQSLAELAAETTTTARRFFRIE